MSQAIKLWGLMNYLWSMLRSYDCIRIYLEYVFIREPLNGYLSASLHFLIHFWMCKRLMNAPVSIHTRSVMSDSLIPWTVTHQAPLCPWNSPGKNTGVGGHSLLQGSSWPRDWTRVSCIAGRFFTIRAMSAPRTVKIVLKIKDLFWKRDLVCYEKVVLEQYQQYLPSTHPAPPLAVPSQGLPHKQQKQMSVSEPHLHCPYHLQNALTYIILLNPHERLNVHSLLGYLNRQVLLAPSRWHTLLNTS